MYIIVALLIFVFILWCLRSSEGYFGFSGYKDPVEVNINEKPFDSSEFVLQSDKVTPDEVNSCMVPAVAYFKEQSGLCAMPIETNQFQKYAHPKTGEILYKFKVMFSITSDRFPYGVACHFDVVNGNVVSATTQQMGGDEPFIGHEDKTEYTNFADVVEESQKVILG